MSFSETQDTNNSSCSSRKVSLEDALSEFKLSNQPKPKKVMSEYKRQFVSHPQSSYQKKFRKRQEISRMEQLQEQSLLALSERKKYHFINFQKHAIAWGSTRWEDQAAGRQRITRLKPKDWKTNLTIGRKPQKGAGEEPQKGSRRNSDRSSGRDTLDGKKGLLKNQGQPQKNLIDLWMHHWIHK